MNKTELIKAAAARVQVSQKEAACMLDALLAELTDALADGQSVTLPGFGTFEVRQRAARTGVNPRTGERLEIASSKAPPFKPSKALKEAVQK